MGNSVCKYCGEEIKWFNEGGKWVPMDPETGLSHRSSCAASGAGGAVKLAAPRYKGVAQRVGEDIRLKRVEERLDAIESKLGMMTYKPFGKIK